ncbi:DUF4097 family beta strand repeat-containing protein [Alkaliphilus transvaalensis]|uniref:DUF4097 family beta strand repeat-containing protein n=1 Tax=Alkaliphilus transvaalensis TaxID=114628 RepID=UPI00047B062E|nr:DUF4097 family beta strand repeat-containing protein [Alkaliphilus transvaalensis]
MNKRVFLDQLEKLLQDLPKEVREDILYDYDEHFRVALEEGKREEEIAKSLGMPEEIVKEFMQGYLDEPQQNNKVNSLINNLGEIFQNFGGERKKHMIDQKEKYKVDDLKRIEIDSNSPLIKIHNFDGDEVMIHLHGEIESNFTKKIMLQTNLINGGLQISLIREIGLGFGIHREKLRLDLYLPNSYDQQLLITTTSGSVEAQELNLTEFSIDSSSGSLRLDYIRAKESRFKANSGSIKLKNYEGELEVVTHSGSIKVEAINATKATLTAKSGSIEIVKLNGEVVAETSSGSIKLESVKSLKTILKGSSGSIKINNLIGDLEGRTHSGSIKVESALTQNTYLKSISGKIQLTNFVGNLMGEVTSGSIIAEYKEFRNSINLTAVSGKIDLTLPKEAQFIINAKTTSGGIKTNFPITLTHASRRSMMGVVGNDENKINLETVSGSIKINQK